MENHKDEDLDRFWYHKCDSCFKQDKTVRMILDPFEEDMNNREVVLATLCPDCYEEDYDLIEKIYRLSMEV